MHKVITEEELQKMLSVATRLFAERDKAIILLLVNTGLRVGELVGLNISDVMNGEVKSELRVRKEIAKRKKERVVPLNDKARQAIRALIDFNKSKGYALYNLLHRLLQAVKAVSQRCM